MPIEVASKTLETDEEGYLANINEWIPEVADVMSKEDGLDLTDEHHGEVQEKVLLFEGKEAVVVEA